MAGKSTAAANEALINRFYTAFRDHDAEAMCACYAPDISFTDPAFGPLEGDRARGMWRMLVTPESTLQLTYEVGAVDASTGAATWVAKYEFPSTHRHVENHISSRFWFEDGLIKRQVDSFDIWKWSSMALGLSGTLLGWSPIVKGAVRKRALGQLDAFMRAKAPA